jgi:hypothetical protein
VIYIVEEIKLLRGNVSYLATWNVKEFTVGYST